MDTIELRLKALEAAVQRSRQMNRLLLLALVAGACMAGAPNDTRDAAKPTTPQQSPSSNTGAADAVRPPRADHARTIEAEQFVLLDRLGRSRARMMVTDEGPEISLFDESGRKRLELSQTTAASGLRLFDSHESPVVSLRLPNKTEPASLEIQSPQGKSLTQADGLAVYDSTDQGRLRLSLINGNFPMLGISQRGQSGPASIELTAGEASRSLKLHDERGFPLFTLFAAENGKTILDMRHPDHERSLQISTGPKGQAGPTIDFFASAKENSAAERLARLQIRLDNDRQGSIRIVGGDGRPEFAAPSK